MTDQHPPQFPQQPGMQPPPQPGFAPQPGFSPQQGMQASQQPGSPSQPNIQPPRKKGPSPVMLIGAIVLAVALLVGGGYLVVQRVLGGDTEQPPGGNTNTGAGQGELPEQPTVEVPAVVTDVAQAAGLTCHDEATAAMKVKGCYLIESGHLVTMRVLMADDVSIRKLTIIVLHNDVEPAKRAGELKKIVDPVLPELPLSDADRDAIATALAGDNDDVSGDTAWSGETEGTFNYRFSKDTTSLAVGEKSIDFIPRVPLVEDHQVIFDELTARGWQCEVDKISIECTDGKAGKVVGSLTTAGQPNNEPRLIEFRVWFNGQQPVVDEPRMTDAYEALAKAGDRGAVLAIGLRMLAEGEKQFFNSDVEFYRGDSYYQVRGVQFV